MKRFDSSSNITQNMSQTIMYVYQQMYEKSTNAIQFTKNMHKK